MFGDTIEGKSVDDYGEEAHKEEIKKETARGRWKTALNKSRPETAWREITDSAVKKDKAATRALRAKEARAAASMFTLQDKYSQGSAQAAQGKKLTLADDAAKPAGLAGLFGTKSPRLQAKKVYQAQRDPTSLPATLAASTLGAVGGAALGGFGLLTSPLLGEGAPGEGVPGAIGASITGVGAATAAGVGAVTGGVAKTVAGADALLGVSAGVGAVTEGLTKTVAGADALLGVSAGVGAVTLGVSTGVGAVTGGVAKTVAGADALLGVSATVAAADNLLGVSAGAAAVTAGAAAVGESVVALPGIKQTVSGVDALATATGVKTGMQRVRKTVLRPVFGRGAFKAARPPPTRVRDDSSLERGGARNDEERSVAASESAVNRRGRKTMFRSTNSRDVYDSMDYDDDEDEDMHGLAY